MKTQFLLGLLILSFLLAGCKSPDDRSALRGLEKEFKEAMSDLMRKLNEYGPAAKNAQKTTSEELKKLFVFEYKVFELNNNPSTSEVEKKLTDLGRERWDCFHVERSNKVFRIFCKRHPETYLRYIVRFLM